MTRLSSRNKGEALAADGDRERRCDDCHARVTVGTDGETEYGHLTGCPQRPDDWPKGGGMVCHRDYIEVGEPIADGGRDIREWIRERVEARIDLEDPSDQYNPWTSKYHLRQDIQHGEFDRQAVLDECDAMAREGEFIYWNGWIAPRRPEVLTAIIDAERAAEVPRQLVIGKCNEALQELRSDEPEVVTDGGQPVNYRSPEPVETEYTRVFVRGDIAEWNTALYELRDLLRTLETADLDDPRDRREAEEALFHGLEEVDLALRDAWDSRVNQEVHR